MFNVPFFADVYCQVCRRKVTKRIFYKPSDNLYRIIYLARTPQIKKEVTFNSKPFLDVTKPLNLTDISENVIQYKPVAVVEFSGVISSGGHSSHGHYFCDIKTPLDEWYHTNDNTSPQCIEPYNVTNMPNMILYKKC